MFHHKLHLLASVVVLAGCVAIGSIELDHRYGKAQPRERIVASLPAGTVDYWSEVQPILDKRCVVCHGCYDAACQLKLNSIEGIERGGSQDTVYHATRLIAAPTSRLFEDAFSIPEWRERGFFPVLNERANTLEANRAAGVMHRLLTLKDQHPLPAGPQLPESFSLSLGRDQFCPLPENINQYVERHPLWGMPYALPGLSNNEQQTLLTWLEQGATYTARQAVPAVVRERIKHWEEFLNGDSLKQQLVSRYLYEHLYIANLYFPELKQPQFFKLVRSSTPPGEPVKVIATRRPYNDPGVERVFYRIQSVLGSIVAKTHLPYALDTSRMERWQALFLSPEYEVTQLPSYDHEVSSNPFRSFRELPVKARYRFLLDEARYTIATFIKGPVCRGSVALNVINDHFWVYFIDPDYPSVPGAEEFYDNEIAVLEFPGGAGNIFRPISYWRRYANQQRLLLAEKDKVLSENSTLLNASGFDLIWDGDDTNQNASLTVFRHQDSATVETGLLGLPPKTAWLIDYSLLERIYYLLVSGYDPYGNAGHQLLTRLYMDFLRMESESNFLRLLPKEARQREREFWYREAASEVLDYLTLPRFDDKFDMSRFYRTNDEKHELFGILAKKLAPVAPVQHTLQTIEDVGIRTELDKLNRVTGVAAALMPQVAYIRIRGLPGEQYVSLIHNNAHLNQTSLFSEQKNRVPSEDTLSVLPGFIGAYPNAFLQVESAELGALVSAIQGLRTEADYSLLMDSWGIRRTNQEFWELTDEFQLAHRQRKPFDSGIIDFNRLENR